MPGKKSIRFLNYDLTSLLMKLRPASTTATILYFSTWAARASSCAYKSFWFVSSIVAGFSMTEYGSMS